MELRQLRYFVKIADMGSMTRASQVLHISQPSLSQQMTQLEREVGKFLFTRIPSGVSITVEGEAFYRQAQQILRQIDDLPGLINEAQNCIKGTIKLTLVSTQAVQFGLPLLVKLRQRYPSIEVELFDNTSSDALEGIASGRRDLGMLVSGENAALLDSEPVFKEELFLASHPEHAPSGESISWMDAWKLPMILPGPSQLDEVYSALAADLDRRTEQDSNGAPGRIYANSMTVFRQAVLSGVAHALQPWGAIRDDITHGAIKATQIEPRFSRTVYISTARGVPQSQVVRVVRQALLEVIREEWERGNVRGQLLGQLAE